MNKKDKSQLKELAKRLKEIRFRLDINQSDFARKIGFAPGYVSEIEKGKYSPGFLFYFNTAKIFNVNLQYLFFGEGEIFNSEEEEGEQGRKIAVVDRAHYGEDTEAIREMLWYFRHSPLVKHSLMGAWQRFIYENDKIIEMDIEKYRKKKKVEK